MTRMKNKRKRMKARLEIIDFSIQYKKMILNYLMQSQMLFSKDYEQNLLQSLLDFKRNTFFITTQKFTENN